MSRIYQTDEDKRSERELAREVAALWGADAVEFPPLSTIDWYFTRGEKIVAIVEVKQRHNRTRRAFSTVLLSAMKMLQLCNAAVAFSAPAFFVVKFTDGVFYIAAGTMVGLPVLVKGRTDRNDKHDIDPCVAVPSEWLDPIEDKPIW